MLKEDDRPPVGYIIKLYCNCMGLNKSFVEVGWLPEEMILLTQQEANELIRNHKCL